MSPSSCAGKYVPLDQVERLAEAGVEVIGENRAQDLRGEARERFGDRFRWHFIGHLQSRKAPAVSELCELCHSLDSLSAARKLRIPALVEVNLAGETSKSGVPAAELPSLLSAVRELGVDVRGLMTMPPLTTEPERSRPYFRELALLAGEHGLPELSMGTTQDYRVGGRGGRHPRAGRFRSLRAVTSVAMGVGNVWNRALVYFGIAEEDEDWDDDYSAETSLERSYSDRPNVRRLHRPRQKQEEFDDWSESEQPTAKPAPSSGRRQAAVPRSRRSPLPSRGRRRCISSSRASFNDAQSIADRFKDSVPVILNLQSADPELAKRLIDFSSGLTYALNGGMQRVADKVFLLTPRNVEVSAEERARIARARLLQPGVGRRLGSRR